MISRAAYIDILGGLHMVSKKQK